MAETICKQLISTIKDLKEMVEADCAMLPHLEMLVVERACNDPAHSLEDELLLPIVRDRIDSLARRPAAKKTDKAQAAMIGPEVGCSATHIPELK